MLLKANPEAANCEHDDIAHYILCMNTKGGLFESLFTPLLSSNKDALKKANTNGNLLIHHTSKRNTLAAVDYFLNV